MCGWPKQRGSDADALPFFNTKLIDKFKNAKSPVPSPTMASPGTFESPLVDGQ